MIAPNYSIQAEMIALDSSIQPEEDALYTDYGYDGGGQVILVEEGWAEDEDEDEARAGDYY